MYLTACYITKNESRNLSTSLATVAPIADRIVVVDTGSTDDTVEIARRCGAEVLSFPWQDDFAAARNFALDHAVPSETPADPDRWILCRTPKAFARCWRGSRPRHLRPRACC